MWSFQQSGVKWINWQIRYYVRIFFSCVTCGGVQASSSSDSFCEITAKTLKIQLIWGWVKLVLQRYSAFVPLPNIVHWNIQVIWQCTPQSTSVGCIGCTIGARSRRQWKFAQVEVSFITNTVKTPSRKSILIKFRLFLRGRKRNLRREG